MHWKGESINMDKMIITNTDMIQECDYLLDIAFKYQSTDMSIIKTNLNHILKEKYRHTLGQREIAKLLNIDLSTLYSYIYISHTTVIPLEKLCWICGKLNVSLEDLFKPVKVQKITNSLWTIDNKHNFIHCYETEGIDVAMQVFNVTQKTAMHYYNLFKRQLDVSEKKCLNAKQIQKK
jgi:transcriptional regulator with XRE-family HTH domain